MHWRQLGSFLLASAGICLVGPAKSDSLFQDDVIIYGTVKTITDQTVTLVAGCQGAPISLAWSKVESIAFDTNCGPRVKRPSISAITMDPCPAEKSASVYSNLRERCQGLRI